jgi:hypothetical protein
MLIDSDGSDNNVEQGYDDAYDCLSVMIKQEDSYTTSDYMSRRRKRTFIDNHHHHHSIQVDNDAVDPSFRGKLCQWSYRICDHFGTNREIVAFAFSFLDRFIDEYSCDRSGFKLAAMTCMYIATKMMNIKLLRICSLVEMCQGEFHAQQFLKMEKIILSALKFRLNPPISQAFILQFCVFLPTKDDQIASNIFSRAIFYAELSVYDFVFVSQSNCDVAIGCVLNAIFDCYENDEIAEMIQTAFIMSICTKIGIKINYTTMKDVQKRLWFLYNCSAESAYDSIHHNQDTVVQSSISKQRLSPTLLQQQHSSVTTPNQNNIIISPDSHNSSPISVVNSKRS